VLQNFATSLGSREQLAIGEFAVAMLVLPKTLAVNAAKDATVSARQKQNLQCDASWHCLLPFLPAQELVAALRAFHYQAQTNPEKKALAHYGLDLVEGKVRDHLSQLEHAITCLNLNMLSCHLHALLPFGCPLG
jgi:T-complex protein 1 subunit alpha